MNVEPRAVRGGSEHDKVTRAGVQPLVPVLGDHDDVLDARTPLAVDVHAGLHAEGHARLQRERVTRHDVGLLVHVETDAVSGAVYEPLPQPGRGDRLAGGGVDLLGGDARSHGLHRALLSVLQYGALAGLTVYAVPQVLAAAAPAGAMAVQMGALVKLTRVLMLGPVTFVAAALTQRSGQGGQAGGRSRLKVSQAAPWFIVGFVLLMAARSLGAVPTTWIAPAESALRRRR